MINLATKLDPQNERQEPYILPLLFDDMLHDTENEFKKFENLNEFIAKLPQVNVNPKSVSEVRYDDYPFKQTVPDFMNDATLSHPTSKQIWREERKRNESRGRMFINLNFLYLLLSYFYMTFYFSHRYALSTLITIF